MAAQAEAVAKAGSGFFLGGGRLVTAAHLVAGCVAVRVVPEGGGELPAEVEASDLELIWRCCGSGGQRRWWRS